MVSIAPSTGPNAAALPLSVFDSLPGAYLLLSPELVIVAATDEYLAATLTRREQLLGRSVLAAFPVPPLAAATQVLHSVRASLEQVLATGQPHDMAVQHYDVPDPDQPGRFVERHWRPRNTPVLDAQGRVQYLIHAVVNVTEEISAAAALAESQVQEQAARAEAERQRERLELLFRQAPALVNTLLGPDHVFELVHPLTYQMLGHRPLAGLPSRQALPELEGPFHELLDEVYHTGRPISGQAMHARLDRHNNGQLEDAYFDLTYQPLYDAAGQVEGVMTFAVEVTEQVQARQRADALQAELLAVAQRQSQERETFYQVFEQTPAAICVQYGPEHRYLYVNPIYQSLFPGREFVGRSVAEALPEVVPQGFAALLDRVYRTGETYYGTEQPVRLAASAEHPARTIYFTFAYQAYRENGEIVGISTFAHDVTEQVRARQEREQQQQRLQELFEQAPVAIAVFRGPQYVIELANPAVCALWGRTPGQALGTPLFTLLPEAAGQGFEELLDEVMATGVPYVAHALPAVIDRHGRRDTVYWNFVYHPLRAADGQITGVTVVATEVSEEVAARQQVQALNEELAATNAELRASNQQLTRSNADLDNFIYTASHDLKTPITNIEGLLHVLQTQLVPAAQGLEVTEVLGMMQNSVERFKRTIENLSDVVKLQKEHNPPTTTLQVSSVLDDVLLDLHPLFQDTHAQLETDLAGCPSVRFSEKNLRSVLFNLLSNALKYHHPDRAPHVHIRCQRQAEWCVLSVQDNGLGIDRRQQRELFVMFRRLNTHVEGSGLGLYMVKRMLDNAGGRIEVQSEPGVGSTFTVFIPR